MSKLLAAILKVCDIDDQGRREDRQDFLNRCAKAIGKLADKDYNALDKDAVAWFNSACDVADANKAKGKTDPLPDFPDLKDDKEEASPRRRGGNDEAPAKGSGKKDDSVIKLGTKVTLITKGGREIVGNLVERTKDVVVLDVDGKEKEYDFDDVGSIEQFNDGAGDDKGNESRDPRVGDTVSFRTKRGVDVEGELIEINDEAVVVKDKEGEADYMLSRIDGDVKVVGGASKGKDDAPSGRRRGGDDDGKGKDDKGADKPPRASSASNGGVSIGQRIRELIVDNIDATQDQINAMLKKEKLDFRDNTLSLGYAEAHKLIKMLREKKMLKA